MTIVVVVTVVVRREFLSSLSRQKFGLQEFHRFRLMKRPWLGHLGLQLFVQHPLDALASRPRHFVRRRRRPRNCESEDLGRVADVIRAGKDFVIVLEAFRSTHNLGFSIIKLFWAVNDGICKQHHLQQQKVVVGSVALNAFSP